jgi:DNA-binding IscR family transcriptional regulator
MQIGTRFSVAIHILLAVEVFKDSHKVTSDFLAGSVNTNPVVIRKIMGLLREAGLIEIAAGTGGIKLTREPERITLLDLYRAVEPVKGGRLFKIHEDPTPACPIGGNIAELLDPYFGEAQRAMEANLASSSLQDLLDELQAMRKRKEGQRPAR